MLPAQTTSAICAILAILAFGTYGFYLHLWPAAIAAFCGLLLMAALFEALHQIIENLRGIRYQLNQATERT